MNLNKTINYFDLASQYRPGGDRGGQRYNTTTLAFTILGPFCRDGRASLFPSGNHKKWRVNLRRGQKTFRLLNYRWPDEQAPDRISGPLHLKRGAYFIDIDFEETPPEFDEKNELVRARTEFTVKYQVPDTEDCIAALPVERLYRDVSSGPLTSAQAAVPAATEYLADQYTSSLRDIRRTYQRAFKALLFCHRLRLSAARVARANVSDIEYILSSPALFAGCTYVAGAPFTSHRASLDFNFLPIGDVYDGDPERNPPAPLDARATPTVRRRQALFDWFERLYNYAHMGRSSGSGPNVSPGSASSRRRIRSRSTRCRCSWISASTWMMRHSSSTSMTALRSIGRSSVTIAGLSAAGTHPCGCGNCCRLSCRSICRSRSPTSGRRALRPRWLSATRT
jgi:hypothetical protein